MGLKVMVLFRCWGPVKVSIRLKGSGNHGFVMIRAGLRVL